MSKSIKLSIVNIVSQFAERVGKEKMDIKGFY
jgi:hypothetical protein